jgi:hypothetical protein
MKSLEILIEDVLNSSEDNRKIFWVTINQQDNGNYLICVMLIKDLALETNKPLGFTNKNHSVKYRIGLTFQGDGIFFAQPQKNVFTKQLFAICLRSFITAWETWKNPNFCGIDFGAEVEAERKIWFLSPNPNVEEAGELDLVLLATKVLKIN